MPGVGVGAGSIKFCRLRPGVAGYQLSTDNDFARTAMCRYETIERQKEKESDSVEIMLKRHLVIEFRLIDGIWEGFGVS